MIVVEEWMMPAKNYVKTQKLMLVSQTFILIGLVEKANKQQNEYAEKGWGGSIGEMDLI